MPLRRPALLALGLAAVLSTPALASGASGPTFAPSERWLSCDNQPTKLYQATWLTGLGDASTYVTWDASKPTSSVQSGAGCGGVDTGSTTNPVYDVALRGTFTGNLREVTLTLNQLLTHRVRSAATERLRVNGTLDGLPLFPPGAGAGTGRTVTVAPVASATGASESLTFTITGLGTDSGSGVAYEQGDGVEEHVLELFVGLDGTSLGEKTLGGWAWDTTETPSGLVFNPPARAAATVAADTPVYPSDEE